MSYPMDEPTHTAEDLEEAGRLALELYSAAIAALRATV